METTSVKAASAVEATTAMTHSTASTSSNRGDTGDGKSCDRGNGNFIKRHFSLHSLSV